MKNLWKGSSGNYYTPGNRANVELVEIIQNSKPVPKGIGVPTSSSVYSDTQKPNK